MNNNTVRLKDKFFQESDKDIRDELLNDLIEMLRLDKEEQKIKKLDTSYKRAMSIL
jgi:hypothetical protein